MQTHLNISSPPKKNFHCCLNLYHQNMLTLELWGEGIHPRKIILSATKNHNMSYVATSCDASR